MPDFKFLVTAVRRGDKYRAMRAAVLMAVLSPNALRDIPLAYYKLRRMWHYTVKSLLIAKVGPFRTGSSYQYARNCPPFGVLTADTGARCCQRTLICPFCWARRVVGKVYDQVESLLSVPTCKKLVIPRGFVVGEFRSAQRVRLPPDTKMTPELWTDLISDMANFAKYRTDELRFYSAISGVVCSRVHPETNGVALQRTGFLLVPAHVMLGDALFLPAGKYAQHRMRWHTSITRRQLSNAVGRVCNYPAGLFDAPPWAVADLLDKFRGKRLLSGYGVLAARRRMC